MTQVKSAPGGKRNWSSGGTAGGRKYKERGEAKGKGTRVDDRNKSEKKEAHKGRQVSAGSTRRWSEGGPRAGVKRTVSGLDRRKRKIDDDSWDDNGDGGKNVLSSKSKFTRKTASTTNSRKVSPGKRDRLKAQSLNEDDSCAGERSTSKVSGISRGVKGRLLHLASKGKKFDAFTEVRRTKKGGIKEVELDEEAADSKKSEDSGLITEEEKPRPRLTRVLDRTGKKIKPAKKDAIPDTDEPAPPKKRKRMKLDPYDTSNKRIEDSPIQDGTKSVLTF